MREGNVGSPLEGLSVTLDEARLQQSPGFEEYLRQMRKERMMRMAYWDQNVGDYVITPGQGFLGTVGEIVGDIGDQTKRFWTNNPYRSSSVSASEVPEPQPTPLEDVESKAAPMGHSQIREAESAAERRRRQVLEAGEGL